MMKNPAFLLSGQPPAVENHPERLNRYTDEQLSRMLPRTGDHLLRSAITEILFLRRELRARTH